MDRRVALAFARFDAAELKFCRYLNRSSRSSSVRQLFRAVSWLGDGWIWYALILALPLVLGFEGFQASLHLAATGALSFCSTSSSRTARCASVRTSPIRRSSARRRRSIATASRPVTRFTPSASR